ncbi:caspase family protein [Leptolyngbya sp. PCC 7375]|nr:caspase family protein [Leptolyngbya sp. PCC 7375]
MNNQDNSTLYALLIGINHYHPNELYKDLKGCVRDIDLVSSYIQKALGVPSQQIWKLISPNANDSLLQGMRSAEKRPTYRNIVATFKQITETVEPGEQVYIHYSGHGGRAKTIYPKLKGEDQPDEVIVPMDFDEPGGRYLRDVELATLLKQMTDKGAIVTVVLDSCHSGGTTRGDCDIRGPAQDEIDQAAQPVESLVASREMLESNWLKLTGSSESMSGSANWVPQSREYVCLAACRPSERAYEYSANGQERNGALTFWMIDTLANNCASNLDYRTLYERISAKIQSLFPNQVPMLMGESKRLVFGTDLANSQYTVAVQSCDLTKQQVQLKVGLAQGMSRGSRFSIYPFGTQDFSKLNHKLAVVEVTRLQATTCTAKIVPVEAGGLDLSVRLESAQIDGEALQGAPAVMESAPPALKRRVRLVNDKSIGVREHELLAELANRQQHALQKVRQALTDNGWLTEVEDDQEAHYQVAVSCEGEYEICIGLPLPNLRPPIKLDDPDAAQTVVKRLVHLAKYQSVQELDNRASALTRYLTVELMTQPGWQPGDPANPMPFDDPQNIEIAVGEFAFLRLVNEHQVDLNVAILDLEPTWAISKISIQNLPSPFYTMAPGEEQIVPLQFALPNGPDDKPIYTRAKETLKVFATLGPADFSWLELPPLDIPIQSKGSSSRSCGALGRLLEAIGSEKPKLTRAAMVVVDPNQEWTSKQVQFTLTQSIPH